MTAEADPLILAAGADCSQDDRILERDRAGVADRQQVVLRGRRDRPPALEDGEAAMGWNLAAEGRKAVLQDLAGKPLRIVEMDQSVDRIGRFAAGTAGGADEHAASLRDDEIRLSDLFDERGDLFDIASVERLIIAFAGTVEMKESLCAGDAAAMAEKREALPIERQLVPDRSGVPDCDLMDIFDNGIV